MVFGSRGKKNLFFFFCCGNNLVQIEITVFIIFFLLLFLSVRRAEHLPSTSLIIREPRGWELQSLCSNRQHTVSEKGG